MYNGKKVSVIIAAAGSGRRMGGIDKMALEVLGVPVLTRTFRRFQQDPRVDEIVLVCRDGDREHVRELTEGRCGSGKLAAVVPGGAERYDSVMAALDALSEDSGLVLVQDGARPFGTEALTGAVLEASALTGAAVPGIPVKDTIKEIMPGEDPDALPQVKVTADRQKLRAVQTPQGFETGLLKRAYARAAESPSGMSGITDDASLVEALGLPVAVVEGEEDNIKVTTISDIDRAERIAENQEGRTAAPPYEFRSGFGYDVHAFAEGRKLVLGGEEIPYELGLLGHSDADVLLHAIMDAMLGAACLGDIGKHFPDTDERYRGISSLKLLEETDRLIREAGFVPVNIDGTVVAQAPKIAPYVMKIRKNIAAVLKINIDAINIKGTTTEKLGFTGRKEGIASYAAVSLYRENK